MRELKGLSQQSSEAQVAASKKGKKFWIWIGSAALLVVLVLGVMAARLVKGTQIDPNRLAKVQRGDVARSVVATGKIQPITKVEVKSKASRHCGKALRRHQ